MTDPNSTLPPVQKAEAAAKSLWVWSSTHTAIAVPIATFISGWLIGKFV